MEKKLIDACRKATLHFELITPEIASQWLQKNTSNYRDKTPNTIRKYSTDMKQGLWTINTATISFSVDGTLVDGQHRLESIIDSGVTVWSYVMRNCPNDFVSDPNQDKGKNRNASVYLAREGFKNASAAAGALRCLFRIGIGSDGARRGRDTLTDAQVVAAMPVMPDFFFDIVNKNASCAALKAIYKPSVMSSAIFLAASHDMSQSDEFVAILTKERDESSSHPANVLREFCNSNRKLITEARFLGLFFTAFNLAIKGERRSILRCYEMPEFSKKQREALDLVVSATTRVL